MLLFTLFFACNESPNDPKPSFPEDCIEIERDTIEDQTILDVVDSNQAFAFSVYSQLKDSTDNIFLSPYSISTAMGMLHLGAEGDTETEISDVLGVFSPEIDWHRGQGALVQELSLIDNCNYQLNTANKAYFKIGSVFEDSYVEGLSSLYGSDVAEIDFSTDAAREEINQWVSEQTMDNIPELFPAGTITPLTQLVLTNAIYMNAPWKQAFTAENTFESSFTLADGSTTTVEMMTNNTADIRISTQEDFQIAEIPYQGDELTLSVILPYNVDGLPAVEEQLNADTWRQWKESLYPTESYLGIPKIEMRYKRTLNDTLKDMGMPSAFEPDLANFSGISSSSLYVTSVIHEAWLKFSEEGTEAAAATGVVVGTESSVGNYISLDRPFIFLIEDRLSGSVLFMGKVTDPSSL